jgi:hypothetical protein
MYAVKDRKSSLSHLWANLCYILRALALSSGHLSVQVQDAQVTYTYDDMGHLGGVITANDEAASYHYDVVGNILCITRETGLSPAATLISVAPNSRVRGASFFAGGRRHPFTSLWANFL